MDRWQDWITPSILIVMFLFLISGQRNLQGDLGSLEVRLVERIGELEVSLAERVSRMEGRFEVIANPRTDKKPEGF